jgi:hypothetical protein
MILMPARIEFIAELDKLMTGLLPLLTPTYLC